MSKSNEANKEKKEKQMKKIPDTLSKELTLLEKEEIYIYNSVYYIGQYENKINKSLTQNELLENSKSFTENNKYILIQNDHIEYRYEILSYLGKGSYGNVIKVLDHKYNINKAIKMFNNFSNIDEQKNEAIFQNELDILYILNKRSDEKELITLFYYDAKWRYHNYIVFKMYGDNLYKSKKTHNCIIDDKIKIIRNIFEALEFLKSSNPIIIHGDLKPENILFKDNVLNTYEVVLGDFGLSCILHNDYIDNQPLIQTRWYRSPEIIYDIPFNEKIDIWSVGCIIYELLKHKPLFPSKHDDEQILHIHYILGCPSFEYIESYDNIKKNYDRKYKPYIVRTRKEKLLMPRMGSYRLDKFFEYNRNSYSERIKYHLIRLVYMCLDYNIKTRINSKDALEFLDNYM